MDLKTVDLSQLQTKAMREDPSVQGFAAALTEQLRQLADEVQQVMIYGRLDQVPEEVLDILAWQFDVDWYDPEADVDTKREAIQDVLRLARIRGTPAAVKRVAEIYLGDAAVEEWFQYSGQPYHFRIVTNNPDATGDKAAQLARAVDAVKNLRSVLDAVVLLSTEDFPITMGFAVHSADKLTIKQVN
ncbi:phage tail protein I [Gorillibacterium sp. sgz5001074]|uniref:phage tail protein I n=1 Tax=Gorillibacterium sp. sgz5001074 TaxID=3446695 RepID=UPI003F66AAC2